MMHCDCALAAFLTRSLSRLNEAVLALFPQPAASAVAAPPSKAELLSLAAALVAAIDQVCWRCCILHCHSLFAGEAGCR